VLGTAIRGNKGQVEVSLLDTESLICFGGFFGAVWPFYPSQVIPSVCLNSSKAIHDSDQPSPPKKVLPG
jgi:hypothetical protein